MRLPLLSVFLFKSDRRLWGCTHVCCVNIYIYISYLSIYKPAGLLSQLDLKQPILLMGTLSVYTSVVAPMYVRQLYIYI
jgi:hypothetical protein